MTRKEQNKILDDKTESNINQYKVDRLNAEISAFSSGDLNKYEFLTRKDLKYKPNALDKARFEFSPLGKAFSTGLDKTVQGYREEVVIKLLKDITDGLRGGNRRNGRNDDNDDNNDDDNDDDNDNDGNDKIFDLLNKFENNMKADMHEFDKKYINEENKWSTKLDKLNKNIKKLDNYIKENNSKKLIQKKN